MGWTGKGDLLIGLAVVCWAEGRSGYSFLGKVVMNTQTCFTTM